MLNKAGYNGMSLMYDILRLRYIQKEGVLKKIQTVLLVK